LAKIIENYLKKKVMRVTGFAKDEITVEKIKGNEYRVTMQAKGCNEKIVKIMRV
jgi:hypothetical protein